MSATDAVILAGAALITAGAWVAAGLAAALITAGVFALMVGLAWELAKTPARPKGDAR